MFLSPENDIYLRDKHCKPGLCPGLLKRPHEQCLEKAPCSLLEGESGVSFTLTERTLQWDGQVCALKKRPGTVGQITYCVSCAPPHPSDVHGFEHPRVLHRSRWVLVTWPPTRQKAGRGALRSQWLQEQHNLLISEACKNMHWKNPLNSGLMKTGLKSNKAQDRVKSNEYE